MIRPRRGLRNAGNTCFINASIQALVSIPMFNNFLVGDNRIMDLIDSAGIIVKTDRKTGSVSFSHDMIILYFIILINEMNNPLSSTHTVANIVPFYECIKRKIPKFSDGKQHDAQEFLVCVLDAMHEELKFLKGISQPVPLTDNNQRLNYWNHISEHDNSIVTECFRGLLGSEIVCLNCRNKSMTYDPFMYLSLELEDLPNEKFIGEKNKQSRRFYFFDSDPFKLPRYVDTYFDIHETVLDLYKHYASQIPGGSVEELLLVELFEGKACKEFVSDDKLHEIRRDSTLCLYRIKDYGPINLISREHIDENTPRLISRDKITVCVFQKEGDDIVGLPVYMLIPKECSVSHVYKCVGRRIGVITSLYREFIQKKHEKRKGLENKEKMPSVFMGNRSILSCQEEQEEYNMFDLYIVNQNGDPVGNNSDLKHFFSKEKVNVPQERWYNWIDYIISEENPTVLYLAAIWKARYFDLYMNINTWIQNHFTPRKFKYVDERVLLDKFKIREDWKKNQERHVDLNQLLSHFTKTEKLTGEHRYRCRVCGSMQDAEKTIRISICPQNLFILLKRFRYDIFGNTREKLNNYIDYPHKNLDLTPFMCDIDKSPGSYITSHKYNLCSVILHTGNLEYGHYTSNCLSMENGNGDQDRWFGFDDTHVFESSPTITNNAYVLCYKRIQ